MAILLDLIEEDFNLINKTAAGVPSPLAACYFIFSQDCFQLSHISLSPFAIMLTTDCTKCDCLKLAASKLVLHPTLSVKDTMQLADFLSDKIDDKNLQQTVLRPLPVTNECRDVGSGTVSLDKEKIVMSHPLIVKSAASLLVCC